MHEVCTRVLSYLSFTFSFVITVMYTVISSVHTSIMHSRTLVPYIKTTLERVVRPLPWSSVRLYSISSVHYALVIERTLCSNVQLVAVNQYSDGRYKSLWAAYLQPYQEKILPTVFLPPGIQPYQEKILPTYKVGRKVTYNLSPKNFSPKNFSYRRPPPSEDR